MNLERLGRANTLGFALTGATVMIAQQVAGKATRDALFLSQFAVEHLPKAVIAGALVSLIGVLSMSRLLPRFGPARIVPAAFMLSAMLFVFEWAILEATPGVAAVVLYLHMTGLGAIVISGFWSLVSERFDPHSAKPRIARIAAGAALGGVLGGLLAYAVSGTLGFRSMLVLLALLNVVCAAGTFLVGGPQIQDGRPGNAPDPSGLRLIRRSRYLRSMALLLAMMAVVAALLDYALKSEAAAHFVQREDFVAFFAAFYGITGVVSFLLQSMLGPKVLQRFGIAATLAVSPIIILLGGVAGSFFAFLSTTLFMRGAHTVLGNSLFRSGFELLYAPLSPMAKRATKPVIDVAADRVGDIIGGGAIALLVAVAPGLPTGVLLLLTVPVAGLCLILVGRLHRGYLEQLAGTLRSGAVNLADHEVMDATTRRILAETSAAAERLRVLERIKQLKREREGTVDDPAPLVELQLVSEPTAGGDPPPSESAPVAEIVDFSADFSHHSPELREMTRCVADLNSGDVARVRAALLGDGMSVRMVPYVIPLLDHPQLAEDARMELRWLVPNIIGQLTDALLDPDMPLTVRQRIPSVLEVSHNPRVIQSLIIGMNDDEFGVRYSCARALARMRARSERLRLDPNVIYAAVRRELGADESAWQTRSLGAGTHGGFEQADSTFIEDGPGLSLDHVFTLLGLILDRDALQLSLQALSSNNRNLRGTALEYLDNVLPEDVRRQLWGHLGLRVREDRAEQRRRPRAD
ncbi:MAG: hypothetical protein KDK91_07835 [Gammaproteobacteria bacterium]|nr:hypothetical protein [Gammaproteobacteria bacterium]